MLATRLQFDAFGLAFSPLDHFYSRTFRDRILSDVKALDHLDFQLRFGNKVYLERRMVGEEVRRQGQFFERANFVI